MEGQLRSFLMSISLNVWVYPDDPDEVTITLDNLGAAMTQAGLFSPEGSGKVYKVTFDGSPKGIRTRYLVARRAPGHPGFEKVGGVSRLTPQGLCPLIARVVVRVCSAGLFLSLAAPHDAGNPSPHPCEPGVRPTILLPNVITRAHDARVPPFGSPKGIRTPVSALRGPRPRPG